MSFSINEKTLIQARDALAGSRKVYWVLGGAGSGKTTVCGVLSDRLGIPVYDMDAHIYGAYHRRFKQERHPANNAWSTARNGLEWLLQMTWNEFDTFNRAALPEYLELLAQDVQAESSGTPSPHRWRSLKSGSSQPGATGEPDGVPGDPAGIT